MYLFQIIHITYSLTEVNECDVNSCNHISVVFRRLCYMLDIKLTLVIIKYVLFNKWNYVKVKLSLCFK